MVFIGGYGYSIGAKHQELDLGFKRKSFLMRCKAVGIHHQVIVRYSASSGFEGSLTQISLMCYSRTVAAMDIVLQDLGNCLDWQQQRTRVSSSDG